MCGGPACTGSLPISLNASKLADATEKNISALRSKLKEDDAKACQKLTRTFLLLHTLIYHFLSRFVVQSVYIRVSRGT